MNDNNLPESASAASDTQPEISGESPQPATPVPAAATTSPGWQNSPVLSPSVTLEVIEDMIHHRLQEYAVAVKLQLTVPALPLPLSVAIDTTATLDIYDPVLVYLYKMREECQRPAPRVPLHPKHRAPNTLASINISIGQMRKTAKKRGEWREGEPLPNTLVDAIIERNALFLPDGTVPPVIYEKLKRGDLLTLEDIALFE